MSLYTINQDKIPSETNDYVVNNTILYPIAKAYLEANPDYNDIIRTYDSALDDIAEIIKTDKTKNEFIRFNNKFVLNFKLYFDNTRIYSPDSLEAKEWSTQGYNPSPGQAVKHRGNYSATVLSDCHYSITQYQIDENSIDFDPTTGQEIFSEVIPNAYNFNIPIPIYSKYCALRHYDNATLMRTGEELALAGYFIIESQTRYIIPIDRKPFNHPIVLQNRYDEQLSRTEVLYTKGFDYEDSYYVVASMVQEKQANVGRSGAILSTPDFVFSLQLNDKTMNSESNFEGKHSKKLINAVPIKIMFYALGCTSDEELLKYIAPQMDDFGLMNAVMNACLSGFKYREAIENANIKYIIDSNYILLDEPLDKMLALYIIGTIILTKDTKNKLLEKFKTTEEYRLATAELVDSILQQRFMPGIGSLTSIDRNRAVCIEMGEIVKSLYRVGCGLEKSQDKTSLTNKRVRAGQQIEREFKSFHGVRLREIYDDVKKILNSTTEIKSLRNLFVGKMPTIINNAGKAMSASLINSFKMTCKEQSKLRTNLITMKNTLFVKGSRREIVKTPNTNSVGSDVTWEHRQIGQSELYFIDPTMTPESGAQTGRFKMPTIYTKITLQSIGIKEVEFITRYPKYIEDIYDENRDIKVDVSQLYNIKINGSIIGYIKMYNDVDELYYSLMNARRTQEISRDCSIILNHNEALLSIWTDTGRLMEPFVKIDTCFDIEPIDKNTRKVKINIKKDFKDWLDKASVNIDCYNEGLDKCFIELLDTEMAITNMVIASCIRDFYENPSLYTHIALPQANAGIVTAMVPAINENKGVRGSLITNHVKQAIGPTSRYPQLKYINETHILLHPQLPLARTCTYDFCHIGETPYGQNIIIAFMYYKYNQEDSIILNKASVENGLLSIDSVINKISEINRDEEFKIPEDVTLHGNPDSYSKLDPNSCLPRRVGDKFYQYDAIIGKISKNPRGISDISILNELPDGKYPPTVNTRPLRSVVRSKYHDEESNIKMTMFGQYQTAIVGDKFNSESAQKGTCGKIIEPEDIPYTSTGLRPDIIFNPPSIFKRETYAQIYIAYVQKICALLGITIDCTPAHTQRMPEDLEEIMKSLGLESSGEETFYDPDTGRRFPAKVFVGVSYYERQPHIVERKLNIRNGGPKRLDSLQSTRGRKSGGGQSLDRMSMDCFSASGIGLINRDAHLQRGSMMKIGVCNKCHSIKTYYQRHRKQWVCPACGAHEDFTIKWMPPAANLITHNLNSLHVGIDYYSNGNADDKFQQYINNSIP